MGVKTGDSAQRSLFFQALKTTIFRQHDTQVRLGTIKNNGNFDVESWSSSSFLQISLVFKK